MIADFEAALADLPPLPTGSTTVALPEPHQAKLAPIYNRLLHRHGGEPIARRRGQSRRSTARPSSRAMATMRRAMPGSTGC